MRSWRQPELVWINPPQPEIELNSAKFAMAALVAAETSSFLTATVAALLSTAIFRVFLIC